MNKRIVSVLCCCGLLGAFVACGTTDGASGLDGKDGVDGLPGQSVQGPAGPSGSSGQNGSDGQSVVGEAGAPGAQGATGASGSDGVGEVGPSGDAGPQGHIGDIACGDTLITAEQWHSACNVNAGNNGGGVLVCTVGQVQCRLYDVDGELVPRKVCYDTTNHHEAVAPGGQAGTTCNVDLDCDGAMDNTTGAGDNVTLVRQSVQAECLVSGSSWSCDRTLVGGVCRNAKKHCLLPSGNVCQAGDNGEGVLWSDFVAAGHEADMGFECTTNPDGTVHTWECTVSGGVASVTCSGPRGL